MCIKNKEHILVTIYSNSINSIETEVVRWCSVCGSVVVDIDVDGRTSPGAIKKMKVPDFIHDMYNA